MRIDCVEVIERAYAPAASPEAWLGQLLEPLEPLAMGCGVIARTIRLDGHGTAPVAWASRGMAAEMAAAFKQQARLIARVTAAQARALLAPPPTVC